MTPDDYASRCRAAGLTVLRAEQVGAQIAVTVAKVPQSASGLQALAARLALGSLTVSQSGAGIRLWVMSGEAR